MPDNTNEPTSLRQLLDDFRARLNDGEDPDVSSLVDQNSVDISRDELLRVLLEQEVSIRVSRKEKKLHSKLVRRYAELSPSHIQQVLDQADQSRTVMDDREPKTLHDALDEKTLTSAEDQSEPNDDSSDSGATKTIDGNPFGTDEPTMAGDSSEKTGKVAHPTIKGEGSATIGRTTRNKPTDPDRLFGDYELVREIARGGMGVVYQARQLKLNRTCALKMILSGNLAGEQEIQRFHTEAESAANLSHSGIVPVYEVGEIEGQHFFSMGYVDGQSLSQEVADGPLEPRRAASLTRDIAEAIAYAHEHGLIHRDLKPANVLIDRDGSPKITDFGLAKQVKNESDLTATGQILGTPSYMPPEQATGKSNEVDETSDVYSIGGILYCLLTGHPPFQASTPMDTLIQVMESEPVPPTRLNPLVPKDLETICLKCLNKEKHRRFETAEALVEELDRFLSDEPILSRPISRLERGWRWCKKRPLIAGLGGAVAALILFVLIAGPSVAIYQSELRAVAEQDRIDALASEAQANDFAKLASQRQQEAETAEAEANAANELAQVERQTALHELYAANISLAHREWANNNVKHARRLLARCPPELRNWEYYYLLALVNQEAMVMQGLDRTMDIAVNEARNELVAVGISGQQWNIKRFDLRTGREFDSIAQSLMISPRANYYVMHHENALVLHRVDDGTEVRRLVTENTVEIRGAAFSPDETLMAIAVPDDKADGTNSSDIHVYNIETGRRIALLEGAPPGFPLSRMAANPWGYVIPIAIAENNQTLVLGAPVPPFKLQVWDLESETKIREMRDHLFEVYQVAISDDGQWIASSGVDGVSVWNLTTDDPPIGISEHLGKVYDLEFSPGGATIATGGWDRSVKVWSTANGEEIATLRGSQSAIYDLVFREGGNQIVAACADGDIRVWQANQLSRPDEVVPERVSAMLALGSGLTQRMQDNISSFYAAQVNSPESSLAGVHGSSTQCVAISPDGKRIATAGHDERVRVFDAATGELLHEFESFVYIHGMQFDPTGQFLAFPNGKLTANERDRPVPGSGWVEIRDVQTGELENKLDVLKQPISSVGYSRDGTKIAAASGLHALYANQLGVTANLPGRVIVWDIESGNELWHAESHGNMAASVSFSVGDQLLATTGMDGVLRVWNAITGDMVEEITNAVANTCTFSGNGLYLAGAGFDGITRVWDADTFELLHLLEAHHGNTQMVAFSPDGTRLFSAGSDATVTVWDPEHGRELLTLRGHSAEVSAVAMDQTGRVLVSSGTTGLAKTWIGIAPDLQGGELFSEVIFEDDFDRDNLGLPWQFSSPDSLIDQGAARTTMKRLPNPALNLDIFMGSLSLVGVQLPDEVQVEFDVWFDDAMGVQIGFVDEFGWFGEYVMSMGTPEPGSGLVETEVMAQNGYISFKTTDAVSFDGMTPGEKHRVIVRRYRDRIYIEIDGDEVLTSELRTILNPRLAINSVYGPVGSHAWFDNLEIRATPSSMMRLQARQLLDSLFDKHMIPEFVATALRQDESLDDALVDVALALFGEYSVDEERLLEQVSQWAIANESDGMAPDEALAYASKLVALEPNDPTRELLLGFSQLVNGDIEQAITTLESAEARFLDSIHYHPGTVALLAVCHKDEPDQAAELWESAIARYRSRHWQDDSMTNAIWEFANRQLEEIVSLSPSESDRLVGLITAAQQAMWIDNNIEPLRDLMTEDCTILLHAAGLDDIVDNELSPTKYLDGSRALMTGARTRSFEFSRPTVEELDNGLRVDWTVVLSIEGTTMKLHDSFECKLIDDQWRITKFSTQIRYRTDARETIDYQVDMDDIQRELEQALASGDKGRIIERYSQAGRPREALRVAREAAEETPNDPSVVFRVALYALFNYEVDEYLREATRSWELLAPDQGPMRQDIEQNVVRVMLMTERDEQLDLFLANLRSDSPRERRARWMLLRDAGHHLIDSDSSTGDGAASFWERHLDQWMDDQPVPQNGRERLLDWMENDSHWALIGLYPSATDYRGFDRIFPIESAVDWSDIAAIAEHDELAVKTIEVPRGEFVDLRREMADQANAVVYAYTELVADEPTEVEIFLGSDDGVKLFHNGQLVHQNRVHRAWSEGRDRVRLTLTEGSNQFLLKIDQAGGEWGFSFDVCGENGWPIQVGWNRVAE